MPRRTRRLTIALCLPVIVLASVYALIDTPAPRREQAPHAAPVASIASSTATAPTREIDIRPARANAPSTTGRVVAPGATDIRARATGKRLHIESAAGTTFTLSTARISRGGVNHTTAEYAARPHGFDRVGDGVTETIALRETVAEQSWQFAREPEGSGDVEVEIALHDVGDFVGDSALGLHFATHRGEERFVYGHATFISADGTTQPVHARYHDGRISMRIPGEVIEAAMYPAVLDPLIGPESAVGTLIEGVEGSRQNSVAVASDGTDFLAAYLYDRDRDGAPYLDATIVRASGTVVHTNGIIPPSFGGGPTGVLRAIHTGTHYLVMWGLTMFGNASGLYIARIANDGTLLDPVARRVVSANGLVANSFALTRIGGQTVLFHAESVSGGYRIVRQTLDASGLPTTWAVVRESTRVIDIANAATNGSRALVVFSEGRLSGNGDVYGLICPVAALCTLVSISATPSVDEAWPWASLAPEYANEDFVVTYTTPTNTLSLGVYADTGTTTTRSSVFAPPRGQAVKHVLSGDGTQFIAGGGVSTFRTAPYVTEQTLPSFAPGGFTWAEDGVAIASTEDVTLAVYVDDGDGPSVAVRISPLGTVLDAAPIPLRLGAQSRRGPVLGRAGNTFLLGWTEVGTTQRTSLVRIDANGVVTDAPSVSLSPASDDTSLALAGADATGGYVIADDDGVWTRYAFLSATGAAGASTAVYGRAPSLGSDGTGYLLCYTAFGELRRRMLDANGALVGTDATISTSVGATPFIGFDGTNYVVVWLVNNAIRLMRVAPNGALLDPIGGVRVTPAGATESNVSFASADGRLSLIRWRTGVGAPSYLLSRIMGGALTNEVALGTATTPIAVAFDGLTTHVVDLWPGLRDRRVRDDGTVLPAFVEDLGANAYTRRALIATRSRGRLLLAYERFDDTGEARQVFYRFVDQNDLGEACGTSATCEIGLCVDGVCCDSACGGGANDCMGCAFALTGRPSGTCAPRPIGAECRASGGPCDVAEVCDGVSETCPSDALAVVSTPCRDGACSAGSATAASVCTGDDAACPETPAQSCGAFACGNATCLSACAADVDCAPGRVCIDADCRLPLANGADCATDLECASRTCTDGVCCDTACGAGANDCMACSSALTGGVPGVCAPLSAALAPSVVCRASLGVCDPSETCTSSLMECPSDEVSPSSEVCRYASGVCDVAERCDGASKDCPMDALSGSDTQCSAPSCVGGIEQRAAMCTGLDATCPTNEVIACGAYLCGTNACLGACGSTLDCAVGNVCDDARCVPLEENGAACQAGGSCVSGVCVDGVCCGTACDGQCESCAEPGQEGLCVPIVGVPRDARAACVGAGTPCGGACDGIDRDACSFPTHPCRDASCVDGVATDASRCDGAGACPDVRTVACAPNACDGLGTICAGGCATNDDCDESGFCLAGVCVEDQPNGTTCESNEECESAHCVDGACCESACDGQCEACGEEATRGACVAVVGAPRGARSSCEGGSSTCGGACDGTARDACDYPSSDVTCGAATCDGDARVPIPHCDGTGQCEAPALEPCAFGCAAGECVSEVPPDAGSPDAGSPDAGSPDAGSPDAGSPDASVLDASVLDASADAALDPDTSSGCGCRVVSGSAPGEQHVGGVVLAVLAYLARRRTPRRHGRTR